MANPEPSEAIAQLQTTLGSIETVLDLPRLSAELADLEEQAKNPITAPEEMGETDDFTDVRDIQAALEAGGIELIERTDADGTGPAHIVMTDPDGNRIMLDQFVPRTEA